MEQNVDKHENYSREVGRPMHWKCGMAARGGAWWRPWQPVGHEGLHPVPLRLQGAPRPLLARL